MPCTAMPPHVPPVHPAPALRLGRRLAACLTLAVCGLASAAPGLAAPLLAGPLATAAADAAAAESGSFAASPCDTPAARAFDFWIGEWEVEQEIRTADGAWERYPARTTVRRAAGGCALVEDWRGTVRFFWAGMREPEEMHGLSVRALDPATGNWRIHWLDSRNPALGDPFVGTFADGVGTFLGRSRSPDGSARVNRIRFFDIRPDAVEWDLAFSTDDGATWTPIWRMHFRRIR